MTREKFCKELIKSLDDAKVDFRVTSNTFLPEVWGNEKVTGRIKRLLDRGAEFIGAVHDPSLLYSDSTDAKRFLELLKEERFSIYHFTEQGLKEKLRLRSKYIQLFKEKFPEIDSVQTSGFDFRVSDDNIHIHFHLGETPFEKNNYCCSIKNSPRMSRDARGHFEKLLFYSTPIHLSQGSLYDLPRAP